MARLTHEEYFLKILDTLSLRATCSRGKSSAIIVRDNRIISTGYVGSPPGFEHCDDIGHLFEHRYKNLIVSIHQPSLTVYDVSNNHIINPSDFSTHCVRTIHAEQNAILNAARYGIALEGAIMYCTMEPCYNCAMSIVSVGIKEVIAVNEYQRAERTREMFKKAGIKMTVLTKELIYGDNHESKE